MTRGMLLDKDKGQLEVWLLYLHAEQGHQVGLQPVCYPSYPRLLNTRHTAS